ncbi:hypothetical protein C8R42DRAFT_639194 [Lentinula raphanica]|nr:hypothetical protein C8R42DRAFT_639194 [Lentinula raphanica]
MIKDWEGELNKPEQVRDKSIVNPYEIPKTGLTEHNVRLHLTEIEAREAAQGSFTIHEIGPTAFISQLLELEDQQRLLRLDIKDKRFETAAQKTELAERRTRLMRLMGRLRSIQALYMPAAMTYLNNRQVDTEKNTSKPSPSSFLLPFLPLSAYLDAIRVSHQLKNNYVTPSFDRR